MQYHWVLNIELGGFSIHTYKNSRILTIKNNYNIFPKFYGKVASSVAPNIRVHVHSQKSGNLLYKMSSALLSKCEFCQEL